MADKDIVSKDLLKRIAVDIARMLLHLDVDSAEIIETEYHRIEDRRADLVAHMSGEEGEFILHIEVQNDNDKKMAQRMLRYRSDIIAARPALDVRQYLLYIGKSAFSMAEGIQQTGLDFLYRTMDMAKVDCQALLRQDTPDALVLAILCDFKGRSAQEVVHFIVQRLHQLTGESEGRFREYMRMLEVLSTNRGLDKFIEEEEKMLSRVDETTLPSYRIGLQRGLSDGLEQGIEQGIEQGMEKGIERGRQQGEERVILRLITRRFGPVSQETRERLETATPTQLENWADNILEARTLEEVFSGAGAPSGNV